MRKLLYWLIRRNERVEDKLNRLLANTARFARADAERDDEMTALHDEILAKLEAANTRQDGFLVLLQALKDAKENPAKLQQIARGIDEQQADWEAAFDTGTPEEPAPEPTPEPTPV